MRDCLLTKFQGIPGILRKLPESSPTRQHVSLSNLSDALANMRLAESLSNLVA